MGDPFFEHRKRQEAEHKARTAGSADLMAGLISVEMNLTELCNRKCVFCPRVDPQVYPNRNLHMPLDLAEKIGRELAELAYKGRVSFSGFGEPLLHQRFMDVLRTMRRVLPGTTLETNTNGDFLTVPKLRELFEAGLSMIYVNLYDSADQREPFKKLFSEAGIAEDRFHLRDHWVGAQQDYGLNLNNRSGMVHVAGERDPKELVGTRCHYPFYKMLIDWDGKVLFCSNDWARKIVVGDVSKEHVRDVWLGPGFEAERRRLMRGDRSLAPCDTCNVVGTLTGQASFDLLARHYESSPA